MSLVQCRDRDGWRWTSQFRNFDLALCAEEGIILVSLFAFLIAAVSHTVFLSYAPARDISRTSRWRLLAKLTFLGLAFMTSLTVLFFVLTARVGTALQLPYALEPLALLVALLLTHFNHLRTRSSSTILLLFWPCYTIVLVIWIRSYLQAFVFIPLVPLKWAVLFFGLLSFVFECVSPDDTLDWHSKSPTLTANIFSIWAFAWVTPLLRKGSRVTIADDDLPALDPQDESAKLGNDLQDALEKHRGLWTALFVLYRGPIFIAGLLKLVQNSLAFVQPWLLASLLSYISEYRNNKDLGALIRSPPLMGYAIATLMFVTSMTQTIILQQYSQICMQTGTRIRAGLITVIYKKSLLSSDERGLSVGGVINLMSVDVARLQDLCMHGLLVISGPFQIILSFIFLYRILGWSAFVGVAIMILSIPLSTYVAQLSKKMYKEQMKNRDKRTRLMGEMLANIKSIKLHAWEYAFIHRVLHVRNDLELKILRKIGIVAALTTTLWSGIPLIVAFGSFVTASVFSTKPLTPDIIFPSISLFMLLQFPLGMFSQVTSSIIEALVSVKRLSDFLQAEELQEDAVTVAEKRSLSIGDEVLSVRDGEFRWSKHSDQPTLEGINLTVRKGESVGILGRVGAGKSSLLSAIIGEMRKAEGRVVLSGTVAYAAQNPWILSATVRDNILFSHVYDQSFYNLVIEACALKPDLEVLPHGDMTEVGEKGITLSGGQRARIALARAVYARADLVLLDDVLAAVDSHVARHIFDSVIGPNGILATKARILVTNSIAYLKFFDQLVYIQHGVILESGSYRQLLSDTDGAVHKLVENYAANGSSSDTADGVQTSVPNVARRASLSKAVIAPLPHTREITSSGLSKEHRERGRVKKEVYSQYFKAASKTGICLFVLATVLAQVASVMSTTMLRRWGQKNRESGDNVGLRDPYLVAYGTFILLSISMTATAAVLIRVLCSLRSSRYLYDSMLESVMRAPLSFFETTPSGRILNLFTRDIHVVDLVLGRVIQSFAKTVATTAGTLLVIGINFPPFLLTVIPLSWLYYRVTVYYLSTSRELKRLDAVSRSPVFTWLSETLSGISTVRAYNQQAIFIAANARRVDRYQRCYMSSIAVNRWLSIRLEFVGALIIFLTGVYAVSAVATGSADAGLVGMVLSYALNVTGALSWLLRSASEVEQNVVSVERVTHYVNDLSSEAPHELPDSKPPAGWPGAGKVEFRDYSLRYRPELDLVLKEISMTIRPAEKIGIVGRTGAGKSSLLLASLRILEAASGKIFIDGLDISTIGLHDLRSVISIVPQSPDLFQGTLRENIDPVGEHENEDIWVALENARLKSFVESLPKGLDTPVQRSGSSLSAGQRQLLCFARALLRKSKVLVLDEATSAVDLDTDRAIQEIVRGPMFDQVTILTIAHRLNTIMESTRVLVLDQGRAVELDTPKALLADKSSQFYSLALEAGIVQDAETKLDGENRSEKEKDEIKGE